jgi:hypothetical protein
MIEFRNGKLKKKEESDIRNLINELVDFYGDFYVTRNNLRLFIKENSHVFFEGLEKGDKMTYSESDGIIFVTGFSDKSDRKYIKPLVKDIESADKLLKVLVWHTTCELWAKVKKNNPITKALIKNNFRFAGDRGKEILLVRKYIPSTKEDSHGDKDGREN